MPIRLVVADWAKPGWQTRRPEQFKNTGMGEALEGFKAHFRLGGAATFEQNKAREGITKAAAVTKAITKAKSKLSSIRDATVKRNATELLTAYEDGVTEFITAIRNAQAMATAAAERAARIEAQTRQVEAAVDRLTMDAIIADDALFEKFATITHNEDSHGFYVYMKAHGNRGTRATFNEYVRDGAPKEINMEGPARAVRTQMIEMARQEDAGTAVDWNTPLWERVVNAAMLSIRTDPGNLRNFKEAYKREMLERVRSGAEGRARS